jgi:hypothetical protein
MKLGISLAVSLWMASSGPLNAAADSRAGVVELLPSPLVMPKRIGPMVLRGEPHHYEDPKLGVSYQYGGDGLSLTVYVYNAGNKELADGADTVPVCREFELAKQGVTQAYQKTELKAEQLALLLPPEPWPLMREAIYEYEREAHPTISFVWITAAANHFVKLRLSMDPRLRDEVLDARRAVLSIVGEAIKPHLAPADPAAKRPENSLGINLNGGSGDGIQAGILYLGLLNTLVEQSPELAPVCGGEVVPDLDTEVGVYRGVLSLDDDLARSRFGRTLATIDKAGFLEEFLWAERHREAWGPTPPANLTLPAYHDWRKKKLKRFNPPDFGTVTMGQPRPLPRETVTP